MFTSILNETTGSLTIGNTLLCTGVSLILGLIIAVVYMRQGAYTKQFATTIVLLPAMVQIVITLVNGNLGTSVAIVGAFGLVRFRSLPGTAREITTIFFVMAIGLATGMGYLTFAGMVTVVLCLVMVALQMLKFGEKKSEEHELRIAIPENLDYAEVFDDLFERYTTSVKLNLVKTMNMGSMFELRYSICLKDMAKQKELIDQIRTRNGNLTVQCSRPMMNTLEL